MSEPTYDLEKLAAIASNRQDGLTGHDTNYYLLHLKNNKRTPDAFVEVGDIMNAMGMTYDEGVVLKALIRMCQLRRGLGKPGSTAVYEAQKMVYSAKELLRLAELDAPRKAVVSPNLDDRAPI